MHIHNAKFFIGAEALSAEALSAYDFLGINSGCFKFITTMKSLDACEMIGAIMGWCNAAQ